MWLKVSVVSAVILVHIVTFVRVQEISDYGFVSNFMDYHYSTSVEEMIVQEDYPLEVHKTKTEDGYVLKMHRIAYSKKSPPMKGKPVVFLMHGLMLSSADFVLMGSDKGLAYILADAGYDVWMGNARGNVHSREHERLHPDNQDFWQFSWHEMGIYDLPAMIDYMLNVTEEQGVHYIGYSQGCTVFLVMCAERPEYNRKIRSMQALGPAAFLSNTSNPVVKFCMSIMSSAEWIGKLFGVYEFLPAWSNYLVSLLGRTLCDDQSYTQDLCMKVFFSMGAFTSKQLNSTKLPMIMSYMPAGASFRQLLHFGQAIQTGTFRPYDYGYEKNIEVYGQQHPPDYNLAQVTAPVALHWSHNDDFTMLSDVQILASKLSNLIGLFEVPDSSFTHFDFLWANEVHDLLYKRVIKIIERY